MSEIKKESISDDISGNGNVVAKFVFYGEPVAQGRPRAARINGRIIMRDPKKSRSYKESLILAAQASGKSKTKLSDKPLNLSVRVYKSVPKSWSKKKRQAALSGEIRPTTRPDLDNYIKAVQDAFNGIFWKDDSQIVSYDGSGKWYSDKPRIEVIATECR